MSVDVLTETTIRAPIDAVASYASDPSNAPDWLRQHRVRRVGDAAAGLRRLPGEFVARFLGRRLAYTYELVELVPDERLVMRTALMSTAVAQVRLTRAGASSAGLFAAQQEPSDDDHR